MAFYFIFKMIWTVLTGESDSILYLPCVYVVKNEQKFVWDP